MKRLLGTVGTAGLLLIATAAMAQGAAGPVGTGGRGGGVTVEQVVSTIVFSLIGIFLAIFGFKLFDLAIKFDLEKEICEKNNLSAAILASAVVLGTCIIVACVVLS